MSLESQTKKDCFELLHINGVKHWPVHSFHGNVKGYGDKRWRSMKTGCKGISDSQFLLSDGSGRTVYLEFKKLKGGRQSDDQKAFEADCIKLNVPYILVSHWMDLAEFLEVYGMLKFKLSKNMEMF